MEAMDPMDGPEDPIDLTGLAVGRWEEDIAEKDVLFLDSCFELQRRVKCIDDGDRDRRHYEGVRYSPWLAPDQIY